MFNASSSHCKIKKLSVKYLGIHAGKVIVINFKIESCYQMFTQIKTVVCHFVNNTRVTRFYIQIDKVLLYQNKS